MLWYRKVTAEIDLIEEQHTNRNSSKRQAFIKAVEEVADSNTEWNPWICLACKNG